MRDAGVATLAEGGLMAKLRENGNRLEVPSTSGNGIVLRLAEAFGFCWGVERAVQMAYEARNEYPDRKLFITNEIIHNPAVNRKLAEMKVEFIPNSEVPGETRDFEGVNPGDVVILPAFGASVLEMKLLREKGAQIVDTTCPWVSKVWNVVEKHKKNDFTSIIHGKWAHEETLATASFAETYLILKNLDEAEWVRNYILNGGNREEFLEKFKNAYSEGFDPDKDLESVGIANQTTMLKTETEAMGKLFEKTMMQKYGVANIKDHFNVMDTICDATQERQDAMIELVKDGPERPDIMLVVGGFNSSNTHHLQELAEFASIPSYWVDGAARVGPGQKIEHRNAQHEMKVSENWINPNGKKLVMGITSGASTPDAEVDLVLDKILASA